MMADYFVHPAAIVESDCIGKGTRIWAFAHVLPEVEIGMNCNLGDHTFVETGARIGDNVTIKNHVCIWAGLTIQNDVFVGPHVTFTNDRFPRSVRMKAAAARYKHTDNWLERTTVELGTSIGAGATIAPGLRLGKYCMIACGAVVTKNVEPFALVGGIPAVNLGWVCRCGNRLDAPPSSATCRFCGETAQERTD